MIRQKAVTLFFVFILVLILPLYAHGHMAGEIGTVDLEELTASEKSHFFTEIGLLAAILIFLSYVIFKKFKK